MSSQIFRHASRLKISRFTAPYSSWNVNPILARFVGIVIEEYPHYVPEGQAGIELAPKSEHSPGTSCISPSIETTIDWLNLGYELGLGRY